MAHKWQAKQGKEAQRGLPKEYQRHWKVFDEQLAQRFPPSRIEDMKIRLHPDAPKTINCKVYPLTRTEEDYVREFLKEEQEKGYIYPGSSPIVSPTFIIGKKEAGEKCIIMDYRQVNKHTVQDNDAMGNIRTILESLTRKKLFSKFNIRWGYKNV